MTTDVFAVLAFIALCMGLFYIDYNTEVSVHICESNGVSTYVSKATPPQELSFGECREEVMVNSRYYYLRQVMKRGSK